MVTMYTHYFQDQGFKGKEAFALAVKFLSQYYSRN